MSIVSVCLSKKSERIHKCRNSLKLCRGIIRARRLCSHNVRSGRTGETHDDPTGSDLKKEGGEISGTFKKTVR